MTSVLLKILLADSSVNLKLREKQFDTAGISISFLQNDVHLYQYA